MISVPAENGLVAQALPQITQVFLTEWTRLRAQVDVKPQAHLRPDLLTIEIRNGLTVREHTLAQTEAGHKIVLRVMDHWIDRVYPRLASQIESLLNCYVTSTGVELEPRDGSVRVQIGLRHAATRML